MVHKNEFREADDLFGLPWWALQSPCSNLRLLSNSQHRVSRFAQFPGQFQPRGLQSRDASEQTLKGSEWMGSLGELASRQWILPLRVHSCPSSAHLPRVRHFRMTSQREPRELRVSQRLVDSQSNPHICESCQDYPSLDCYQKKNIRQLSSFWLWKCSFFHLLVFLYHFFCPWHCDLFSCRQGRGGWSFVHTE